MSDKIISRLTRREFLKAGIVAGAATTLAACAPSSAPSPSAGSAPATTPAAGGAPAAAAPAVKGATKLRFWTYLNSGDKNSPRGVVQAQNLEAFKKANPSIELTEELIPWQNISQQLLQAAAANKAPDVCLLPDTAVMSHVAAGSILPLDEFVSGWSAAQKGDFVYPWSDGVVDGKKYAFKHAVRAQNMMFYRTDLYEAAGAKTWPKTIKEFTEVTKAITKGQMVGFTMPFSKSDALSKFMQEFPSMIWSAGGDIIDPNTSKATFHLDAGQKVFQWIQDMVHVHKVMPVGAANQDAETVNQMFTTGTLATNFDHNEKWGEYSSKEAIKGKIETGWMPTFSDDPSKASPVNTAGGWVHVMAKGANKEAAWKLLEFFHSPDFELTALKGAGQLPTRKSLMNDLFFSTDAGKRAKSWLDYMVANQHEQTVFKIKKIEALTDALADAAQQIIANKADVKSTLAAAAQKYDSQIS